ncbi:hypothetical protein GOD53_16015 [Sinorhizobium medicae]|nr:hypothetical protein [Sinorhizobium medicae]MDX0745325.1 hypothetical protein [Sinorhizobium medicae]RVO70456.1 hypothetical protein CN084_30705 [Sinorhizobium medicae]
MQRIVIAHNAGDVAAYDSFLHSTGAWAKAAFCAGFVSSGGLEESERYEQPTLPLLIETAR